MQEVTHQVQIKNKDVYSRLPAITPNTYSGRRTALNDRIIHSGYSSHKITMFSYEGKKFIAVLKAELWKKVLHLMRSKTPIN